MQGSRYNQSDRRGIRAGPRLSARRPGLGSRRKNKAASAIPTTTPEISVFVNVKKLSIRLVPD